MLCIVDEFRRECHLLHVDRSIGSKRVKEHLIELIENTGGRTMSAPTMAVSSLGKSSASG